MFNLGNCSELPDLPKYGTSTIKCGKKKCGWIGTELELVSAPHRKFKGTKQNVCPDCGCDSYHQIS